MTVVSLHLVCKRPLPVTAQARGASFYGDERRDLASASNWLAPHDWKDIFKEALKDIGAMRLPDCDAHVVVRDGVIWDLPLEWQSVEAMFGRKVPECLAGVERIVPQLVFAPDASGHEVFARHARLRDDVALVARHIDVPGHVVSVDIAPEVFIRLTARALKHFIKNDYNEKIYHKTNLMEKIDNNKIVDTYFLNNGSVSV